MKSKEAKLMLIRDHGPTCFLGGVVSKKNPFTVHHLVPIRAGGLSVYANFALLCRLQHDMFNVIEFQKPKIGLEITDYFYYFKKTNDLVALKQMKEFVEKEIKSMDYHVETTGKLLVLRR